MIRSYAKIVSSQIDDPEDEAFSGIVPSAATERPAGECGAADLPGLRHAATAGAHDRHECRALEAAAAEAIRAIAAEAGVAPAVIVAAGFAALSFRLTDASPVTLAVAGAARRSMRIAIADSDRVTSLAGRLNAALAAPAAVPPPWTNLLVALEPAEDDLAAAEDGVDLVLRVRAGETAITVDFAYAEARFAPGAVARIADGLALLLADFAAAPDRRVAALDILPPAERRRILEDWNRTEQPFPDSTTLHALFRAQAARTPDAPAVDDGACRLTYGELDRRSERLAALLVDRGAGPGTRIGVCVDRSVALPVALLGILKSGAAYVPLDPNYPAERIGFMLKDAAALLVVSERSRAAALPDPATPFVPIDELDLARPGRERPEPPSTRGSADDLAYVIYTSGSTGRPKGVQLAHRGVVNLVYAMRDELGFTSADRVLAVTSISFDISVLELFLPLLFGATLVLAARRETTDGALILARLAASRASLMQATPVTWRLMLEAGWRGSPGLKLLCGGEAIDPELARRLVAQAGGRFWNVYGPTETTIWSTARRVTAVEGARVPIGRPLANTRLYILDREHCPVPVGVAGELYIAGAGVARGYLNRPELSAERFVPDPFDATARPDQRPPLMYRTGDLARYAADGTVEFLGRLDHQVKIRGFRIELGEIETVLGGAASVRQAVVVAAPESAGGSELVAFVVPAETAPSTAALRRHAGAMLPDYMVPSRILVVEALPLTPNGKIDRNALLALIPEVLGSPGEESRAGYRPAGDALEATLVEIFEDVLSMRPIGIDDDFFDLGGHSLRAVRMIDLIDRHCGQLLSMNTIYHQGASVAYLAGVLKNPGSRQRLPYLVPLSQAGAESSEPAIFCLHTLVAGALFYYQPLARRLGRSCALFGILPRGLDDGLPAHASIEAMAAHCIAVMRAQQPRGPYRFIGFSSAGILAFEIAHQLRRAGIEVALLGLLDSHCPAGLRTSRFHRERMADRLRRLRAALAASRLGRRRERPSEREAPSFRALRWRHRWALRRYKPRWYDGRVTLVKTADAIPLFHGGFLGWDSLAGDFDCQIVPGGHYDFVNEPGVARLAAVLRPPMSGAGDGEAGVPVALARPTIAA